MEENSQKMAEVTKNYFRSSLERRYLSNDTGKNADLLTKRLQTAIDTQNGMDRSSGDNDSNSSLDDNHGSAAILLGSSIATKNAVQPIKLTEVKRLPPYTTWIFLDK